MWAMVKKRTGMMLGCKNDASSQVRAPSERPDMAHSARARMEDIGGEMWWGASYSCCFGSRSTDLPLSRSDCMLSIGHPGRTAVRL
jgi:hypothetical protein